MPRQATATADLVATMRIRGAELTMVEVKAARNGLPARGLRETLSAFSNGGGGVLLLGLDESDGFSVVAGFAAQAMREGLAGLAANDLTPPVRGEIEVEPFEGGHVVRMDVEGLPGAEKPCFVTTRGAYGGSFIRGGDGDRHLTEYEITVMLANRGQPHEDLSPVPEATIGDLDEEAVRGVLEDARRTRPRSFGDVDEEIAMRRLRILVAHEGRLVPSLAGLLALGEYPQQFFPQLFISFVALPGTSMGDSLPDGTRFLDNQTCDGPIPAMVTEAVDAVARNLTRAAVVRGVGRTDVFEYPIEVVRELIVNAVMHRDYSPLSRGTQVQVELFPDRLEVRNPGGLFGAISVDQLGTEHISTSRNAALAMLLSEIRIPRSGHAVAEARGSGLPRVAQLLTAAGLPPPEFRAQPASMNVTIRRDVLPAAAPDVQAERRVIGALKPGLAEVLSQIAMGADSSRQLIDSLALSARQVRTRLRDLIDLGLIEPTAKATSRDRRYRLTQAGLMVKEGARDRTGFPSRGGPD